MALSREWLLQQTSTQTAFLRRGSEIIVGINPYSVASVQQDGDRGMLFVDRKGDTWRLTFAGISELLAKNQETQRERTAAIAQEELGDDKRFIVTATYLTAVEERQRREREDTTGRRR